eukprot:TRINITY_DN490_c0_g2_i1.p1 TRINITY_DN490_c0_g2~~TRINITY_DN490_c0_g2_i1.p1  ORF type:complete len:474 (+),score=128.07 TRINITY_DN490_c0_g2_i1:79-1500(+)
MLCLHTRLSRTVVPGQRAAVPVITKRYKKKLSPQEVQEAIENKRSQKKTALEKFVAKFGVKDHAAREGERNDMSERAKSLKDRMRGVAHRTKLEKEDEEADDEAPALELDDEGNAAPVEDKKEKGKKKKPRTRASDRAAISISQWHEDFKEAHWERPEVQDALSPQLSLRMYHKILHLYYRDPNYWTPVRLASLARTPVEYMRGLLWEAKLIREAGEKDIVFDDDIDHLFIQNFGEVDYCEGFEDRTDFDVPVKKVHNPWYFVDPGLKSGELLKFVRSRETRYFREASRIPTQRLEPVQEYPEVLPPGVAQKKMPGKKGKYFMLDASSCYNLYTRPIIVRDEGNNWRTPTWEERRWVFNWRRPMKARPFKIPFVYPDNNQPDRRAIEDKAPNDFDISFPFEDEEGEDPHTQAEEDDEEEEFVGQGGKFSMDKWELPSGRGSSDPEEGSTKTDFNAKYRVKYDHGNHWKDPAVW